MKRKVVIILGPTAVGKSALGVELARKLARTKWGGFDGAEIISADSRQVYKGLNIGTGKITKKETRGISHYLLDVTNPKKQMSVSRYQKLARKKMEDILRQGKLPIIVGGTGLYIDSIVNDISFPEVPPNFALRKSLEKKSSAKLFVMLKKLDTRRAKTIDARNPRRLVRAIEIATAQGYVPPYRNAPREDIETLFIGLALPTEELHKRITLRLFARIRKQKMIEEVRRLHRNGLPWKRMDDLGLEYRYISRHLRGLLTRDEMLKELQSEIVSYAKRQMTWFKRNEGIQWFKPNETAKIQRAFIHFLKKDSSVLNLSNAEENYKSAD